MRPKLMAESLTHSITVAKLPTVVWNLLTLVEQITDWYDDWDEVDRIRPRGFLRVGTTFRLARDDRSVWCHVTVADPPARLRWLEIDRDWGAVAVQFRLDPDGAGGTVVTHTKTIVESEALQR
jgi:hypothetical protein